MFEILSDASWLKPQIDFLLSLQNLRLQYGSVLNPIFMNITVFGEYLLPTIICSTVYWAINSKNGMYIFAVSGFNVIFAHLFKLLACVYRPWVLSDKINPFEAAINHARSYSFPSGHSACSSSTLGALAYVVRKNLWAVILLITLVLLVGFSRMWLGVHTPQDIIGGFSIGLIIVFALVPVIDWAENNKNRYLCLAIATDIIAALILAYLCYFHQYPLDYVNGELLVNPTNALHTTIACYGYALGVLNGLFLCRRFLPFDASAGSLSGKITRVLTGILILLFLFKYVFEYVWASSLDIKIVFVIMILLGLFPTIIYPYVFTNIKKYTKEKNVLEK